MDTDNLKILIDVARLGSFAAAARVHNLDPSSVSRTVALIERDLGIRIFQRTTRHLSLSEPGETYLQRLKPVLEELDHALDDAARQSADPTGTLRLTTSVAFGQVCIVPLLSEFKQAFPDLTIELLMTDSNVDLVRERIDLGLRLGPSIEGDLVCARLCRTHYRVCASPAYLENAPPLAQPGDLKRHSALLFPLPEFRRRWLFRNRKAEVHEVPIHGDILISNALALKDAAIAGLGPVLLADWLVDKDIEQGRLINVLADFEVTATTFDTAVWIVYPSRAFLPVKVRATIDFLRHHLA